MSRGPKWFCGPCGAWREIDLEDAKRILIISNVTAAEATQLQPTEHHGRWPAGMSL